MPPTPGPSCNAPWGYLSQPNGNCRYVSDPNIQTCMLNDNLSLMRYPEDYGTGIIQNTVNSYSAVIFGRKIPMAMDWPIPSTLLLRSL